MDVEWIILADAAEVLNNKLYLLGGGWETLTVNAALPAHHSCAVALAISVPWHETNQQHNLEIEIVDDGGNGLTRIGAQVEVGRPAGIPRGQAQRIQLAMRLSLSLDRLGTFFAIARIGGEEARRIAFNVIAGPSFS